MNYTACTLHPGLVSISFSAIPICPSTIDNFFNLLVYITLYIYLYMKRLQGFKNLPLATVIENTAAETDDNYVFEKPQPTIGTETIGIILLFITYYT